MSRTYEKENQINLKTNTFKDHINKSLILPERPALSKLTNHLLQLKQAKHSTKHQQKILPKYGQQRGKHIPLANQDFLRIQEIRKENQKKMMELGLQPKRIYEVYYKKQETQSEKKIDQSIQATHKSAIHKDMETKRVSFNPEPEFSKKLSHHNRAFSFSRHDGQFLKSPIQSSCSKFESNFGGQKDEIRQFSTKLQKSRMQKSMVRDEGFQKKQMNSSQFQKSRFKRDCSREIALRQVKNDIKAGIQRFSMDGQRDKTMSQYNIKETRFKTPIRKNPLSTSDKNNDPRIQSIDRINNKIRLLLSSIQKDQKNVKDSGIIQKNSKVRDFLDQQNCKKSYIQSYEAQSTQRESMLRNKLQAVQQRNKRIKKLQQQREAKFQQWKKNGIPNEKRFLSKPPLKPVQKTDQKGWDDDIRRIQEKLKKVQQQKKKLQRQSAQKLKQKKVQSEIQQRLQKEKGSRIQINFNRFEGVSSRSRSVTKSILESSKYGDLNRPYEGMRYSNNKSIESSKIMDNPKYRLPYQIQEEQIKPSSQFAEALQLQIDLDLKLRQAKKQFQENKQMDKWNNLKKQLELKGIFLSDKQIKQRFTPTIEQTNPFKSQYRDLNLVDDYIASEQNFRGLLNSFDKSYLRSVGNKLGKVFHLQDMVRYVNMQCNTFYRNRDLFLLFMRMGGSIGQGLSLQQVIKVMGK